MTLHLTDTIVPALQARIIANMPAVVADINSTLTNPAITIEVPQSVYDFVPSIGDMYQFPIVGILDGPTTLEDDVGYGATGVSAFTCIGYIQDSDLRTLAWKLRRFSQALVRAIRGVGLQANLGEAWGMYDFAIEPGPTLGNKDNARLFMSSVAVSFKVKSEQDYS